MTPHPNLCLDLFALNVSTCFVYRFSIFDKTTPHSAHRSLPLERIELLYQLQRYIFLPCWGGCRFIRQEGSNFFFAQKAIPPLTPPSGGGNLDQLQRYSWALVCCAHQSRCCLLKNLLLDILS